VQIFSSFIVARPADFHRSSLGTSRRVPLPRRRTSSLEISEREFGRQGRTYALTWGNLNLIIGRTYAIMFEMVLGRFINLSIVNHRE